MLLTNLLKGYVASKFILLKDNCTVSPLHLLKEVIKWNLEKDNTVYFVSLENRLRPFFSCFESCYNYKLLNVYSSDDVFKIDLSEKKITDLIKTDVLPERCTVIIIDSINIYLQAYGMTAFTRLIQEADVKKKSGELVYTIIGVAHWDDEALSETALGKQTERLATSVLTLFSSVLSSNPSVSVLHKKSSGRHLNQKCEWWLSGNKVEVREVPTELLLISGTSVAEPEIPKSLTTFRIELDEQEKASRDNLVLPYMKHLRGKIHYEPDANDDWDDEDPDDDLEI